MSYYLGQGYPEILAGYNKSLIWRGISNFLYSWDVGFKWNNDFRDEK